MSTHQKLTLKNGARLILVPYDATNAATVLVYFRVGSRYETVTLNGASHYIEHLMFKGTRRRPNTTMISRELDSVGAEYNAFTGKDHTGYYIKIRGDRLELACDMLSDMLFHSIFAPVETDRERKVIIEEIHMYEDNPMMFVEELFEQNLYDGSTLGWRISGTRQTMEGIKRQEMIRYRDRHYRPSEMIVVVAGQVPEDAVELIERTFGEVPEPKGAKPKPFAPFRVSSAKFNKPRLKLHFKETEQVQLALGFPALGHGNPRLPAQLLLSVILGGNMSSRLFIQVRERRGLCYFIRASSNPYEDVGNFLIQSGLARDRLPEALRTIMAELGKIRTSGVTEKELDRAKEYLRGKITLGLEESNELADWYGRQELFLRKMETPEEKFARISAVTRQEVGALARELFANSRLRPALIGPFKDEKPFIKHLRI